MLNRRQKLNAMKELWQNGCRVRDGRGLSGLEKYRAAKESALRHDAYIVHRWRIRRLQRLTHRLSEAAWERGEPCLDVLVFKATVEGVEREFKAFYDNTCCGPSWTVVQWEPFKTLGVWHIKPDAPIADIRILPTAP
jgi:hypothetical protein